MKRLKCQNCSQELEMNNMCSVLGQILCKPCGELKFQSLGGRKLPPKSVVILRDPTICAQCGRDFGQQELPITAGIPLCNSCREALRKATAIPVWVKLSIAAVILLAAVVMVRNWRFFQAYSEIPKAVSAFKADDIEKASNLAASASAHVPEDRQLAAEADYLHAMALMRKHQFRDAVTTLEALNSGVVAKDAKFLLRVAKAEGYLDENKNSAALDVIKEGLLAYPQNPLLMELQHAANIAVAFDGKDYDMFLRLAEESVKASPDVAECHTQLASAISCKFAVTGDEQYKTRAMAELDKARNLAKDVNAFREYEERILHRISTREIISKEEYDRRFRQGKKG